MIEAVDLGTENDVRMARLREALMLGDGFQLLIVQVELGDRREEVLRRLAGWSGRLGVPRLALVRLAPGEPPLARLGHEAGVILVGFEAAADVSSERFREVIAELNWSRDRLPALVPGPLILVVSQRVQTALFEQAPDFYSWRAHSTSITIAAPRLVLDQQALDVALDAVLDSEDPAALEDLIAGVASLRPPALQELARLRVRLARARLALGELEAADAAVDAAEPAVGDAGTTDDRVDLHLLRKDIAHERGHEDAASAWLDKAQQEATSGSPSPLIAAKLLREEAMRALADPLGVATDEALSRAIAAFRALGVRRTVVFLLALRASVAAFHSVDAKTSFLQEALELARGDVDASVEVHVLRLLALDAADAGRGEEAEQWARDAVARAEAGDSQSSLVGARVTLGNIAVDNGHWALAEDALDVASVPSVDRIRGELAEARARLGIRRGDDVTSEHYLREALDAYRRGDPRLNQHGMVEVSLQLGDLGRRTQNWTLAMAGFETAERRGDVRQQAAAAAGMAALAFDQGERTARLAEQLDAVTRQLIAVGNATMADTLRARRGVVLLALGRHAEAYSELETARAAFEARGQAQLAEKAQALIDQALGAQPAG